MASGRLAGIFITVCAIAVAAALWALLVLKLGLSHPEAGLIAGLVLLSLAQFHIFLERQREKLRFHEEMEDVLGATQELRSDLGGLKSDVDGMRSRLGEKNFLHAEKLASQVAMMETLIQQLAEEAARRDALEEMRLERAAREIEAETLAQARAEADKLAAKPGKGAKKTSGGKSKTSKSGAAAEHELTKTVRRSLESNRVDLYLQPIVTLPQRKVRFYEALSRLRDEDGSTMMPQTWLGVAETSGLMPMLDNLLLFRSVGVVRKLVERKRDVGVFCNISARSLLDEGFFSQFVEFMELNSELADCIIFEFAQGTYDELGPLEIESLNALASHGFRFSMDHVTSLDIDFKAMHGAGFRYIKVGAAMILSETVAGNPHIHPHDLGALAARHGIELVVEKIESEHQAVNLLDCDVKFGQGYLFARPRLVRETTTDGLFSAAA
ncbi:hypothetical protein MNBD_ALPHA09-1550 [hydrothermal vent metagenome]|uniref:EAL domain-containing protein n=1 Tax=hydrothermal vent metagenome TaxID=652676 RepID=A0A3B0TN15_9ZZZZ